MLRDRYLVPVGYSGHEVGLAPSVAAAALGASMVERHITVDRALWGTDQSASVEPGGFNRMIKDIRAVETAMGDGVKRVFDSELPLMGKLRRVGDERAGDVMKSFRLDGRVAVITGGAGLLGVEHAAAISGAGGIPVLVDIDARRLDACEAADRRGNRRRRRRRGSDRSGEVRRAAEVVRERYADADILVNNAAGIRRWRVPRSRFESIDLGTWEADLAAGLGQRSSAARSSDRRWLRSEG